MNRGLIIVLLAVFCLSPAAAHAGLFKQAVKHPFLTGAAVVAGAAIATHAGKQNCAKGSGTDGMPGSEESGGGNQCQGAGPKVSLVDKAELALLKSQTKELRRNLAANGEKESKGCAAHHIVPKNENRDWAKEDVEDARGILDSCGIGIDDAANGLYLPFNDDAECEGANHRKLHTKLYYEVISRALVNAFSGGCDQVQSQLKEIKNALRQNTLNGGVK